MLLCDFGFCIARPGILVGHLLDGIGTPGLFLQKAAELFQSVIIAAIAHPLLKQDEVVLANADGAQQEVQVVVELVAVWHCHLLSQV